MYVIPPAAVLFQELFGPYSDTHQSTLHPHILSPKINYNIRLGFFPSDFRTEVSSLVCMLMYHRFDHRNDVW